MRQSPSPRTRLQAPVLVLFFLLLAGLCTGVPLFAVEPGPATPPPDPSRPPTVPEKLFPALYHTDWLRKAEHSDLTRPASVMSERDHLARELAIANNTSPLLNNDVLAFYGSPLSPRMGILGAWPRPALKVLLDEWALAYDEVNGRRGVMKAFYIIYGTAWPEGEIGILKDEILLPWIEYALEHDILVYLDHQIGKYTVSQAMDRILPYLRYPNVHLAIDPEWRTLKPMKETGSVTATEVNAAQEQMQNYMLLHGIPGERQLVIHQFKPVMIRNRDSVRSDFARVRLVHCADGFGSPALKRLSYKMNAQATNIPVKGFKLFFKSSYPGAGFDEPLMAPADVVSLEPRPWIIMYQ